MPTSEPVQEQQNPINQAPTATRPKTAKVVSTSKTVGFTQKTATTGQSENKTPNIKS